MFLFNQLDAIHSIVLQIWSAINGRRFVLQSLKHNHSANGPACHQRHDTHSRNQLSSPPLPPPLCLGCPASSVRPSASAVRLHVDCWCWRGSCWGVLAFAFGLLRFIALYICSLFLRLYLNNVEIGRVFLGVRCVGVRMCGGWGERWMWMVCL